MNLYKLDQRFKQSRINIESFHSTVLLTGQVPDPYLKQLAEDNVKAMSDVKAVHLHVVKDFTFREVSEDEHEKRWRPDE
ncbi:BON domain-containing protein, partial [Klebsiella pneumoniae]